MSSYRRIAEQIITLLTILVSIVTVLRQANIGGIPFDLTVRQERSEQVERSERLPPAPPGNRVKTKIR